MEEFLTENNLTCQMGPEVECFVFDNIIFNHKNNNNLNGDRSDNNSEYHEPKILSVEGGDGRNTQLEGRVDMTHLHFKILC